MSRSDGLSGTQMSADTIELLGQEKAALQTQNAQLWRLVDKQRAMILGLQKDLDKANQIAKDERAKSRGETGVSAAQSSEPPTFSSVLPYPTTPEHGAAARKDVMPSAPKVIEDYDDNSTTTDRSPDSTTSPQSSKARRPPARLNFQATRSLNHEDFPAKSPLRSSGSSRGGIMTEDLREQTTRGDGSSTPMSPSLSMRMQQISRSGSPLVPPHAFSAQGFEEIDRVSVPRRERVRTASSRSIPTVTRASENGPSDRSDDLGSRSNTSERHYNHSRPHGFIEDSVSDAVDGDSQNRFAPSASSDSIFAAAQQFEPPPRLDDMPHSDSGGTLADIAAPYYHQSSSFLTLTQASSNLLIDLPPRTLTPPRVVPDPNRSPGSVYDDDDDDDDDEHAAGTVAQTPDRQRPRALEPAAEFFPSPELVWEETSPEKPRKRSELSISESITPSESVLFTGVPNEAVVRHVILPEILGSINVYMVNCRSQAEITIGVFRKDMLLIHKVEKSYEALSGMARSLNIEVGMDLPPQEDFESTQPSKVSSRRATVDLWLSMIQTQLQTQPQSLASQIFCSFLSSDYLDETESASEAFTDVTLLRAAASDLRSGSINSMASPMANPPLVQAAGPAKEGYLLKRNKNFGGWKGKYFVLDGPFMRIYESQGGSLIGAIRVAQAQIGRQQPTTDREPADTDMRHAFLILEPKKKNVSSFVRHVLCADNDAERDDWIRVLLHYVQMENVPAEMPRMDKKLTKDQQKELKKASKTVSISSPQGTPVVAPRQSSLGGERFGAIGYGDTQPGRQPLFDAQNQAMQRIKSGSPGVKSPENDPAVVSISGPMNGAPIDNNTAWGATTLSSPGPPVPPAAHSTAAVADKKTKKKSFWAFGKSESSSSNTTREMASTRSPSYSDISFNSMAGGGGAVFGAPLVDAVQASVRRGLPTHAPLVLYRCIQYLDAKQAEQEEGIYRLSGSNTVIRGLKERFNTEADIDLLAGGEYFDIHAVAGLLKLYLRELPSSILTRDLQRDFMDIIEMPEGLARMTTVRTLVRSLPRENYELLKILSGHLQRIVNNAQINKMTLRNVGIVFSPTLNIPAGVFSLFIAEYDSIFDLQASHGDMGGLDTSERERSQANSAHGSGSSREPTQRANLVDHFDTATKNGPQQAPMEESAMERRRRHRQSQANGLGSTSYNDMTQI